MVCWRCHESVGGPVCVGCGAIQPPRPDASPFEVLGLAPRFGIEPASVDAAWRELSRKVHPDRFASGVAVERRMSLQWTAQINEARKIVRDPRMRAHYLATGHAKPPEDRKIQLEPRFLEEMFELQMEARMDPDGTRPEIRARIDALWSSLRARFESWEAGTGNLEGVEESLAQLRYLDNAMTLTQSGVPAGT